MSRPLPRRQSAATVQPREQQSSSRAPSTIPPFVTQEPERYFRESVVPDTPNKSSGRRHATTSQNVQTISSTSATPSQHSVERPKRTENHQKRQSAIPQAESPGIQSSQSKIKAKQVATDHLQALDDTPSPKLLKALRDAQRALLNLWIGTEGLSRTEVLDEVLQVINDEFPELRESTQPTQSTTALAQAMAAGRHPDVEYQPSAPTSNNMRESQHGSNSPRDATGSMVPHREGTSSRLTTPLPVNEKGKSTPTLRVWDLKSVTINNEQEFDEAFGKYGLDAITIDKSVIKLLDLAKETVEDVKPKFQEHQRELGEAWQVLFTIIANMFVFGPGRLYRNVKALSKQSSTDSNEHSRRNRRGSNDAVDGPMSEDGLFKIVPKEELEELAESMRWWYATKNNSQTLLGKVYANYRKLKTVHQFDAMMSSWEENARDVQDFVRGRVGERQDPDHYILSYIWHRITGSRGNNTFTPLPKDSKKLKKLAGMIFGFRPICSLVDAFGEGVLLLFTENAEKHVLGKVEEGQKNYPQYERIRDIAQSLREVDRTKHDGQLCTLFTDLDEKALRRIKQQCEGSNTGSLLYDCPRWNYFFNELDVGKRISCILKRISEKESTDTSSDIITTRETRARTRSSKRNVEEAVDGQQGTSKRQRTGSGEDEESSHDGSESNTDSEEDLYLP